MQYLNIPFDAAVPNSQLYRLAGVDLTSLNELDAITIHIIPTLEGLPTFQGGNRRGRLARCSTFWRALFKMVRQQALESEIIIQFNLSAILGSTISTGALYAF
jgi:hypothetical protein